MMTFKQAQELLRPYTNADGLIVPGINSADSGNEIAYSALVAILLVKLFPDEEDAIFRGFMSDLKKCEVEPGLFARTPDKKYGNESWDDHSMIACACVCLHSMYYPLRIMGYGKRNWFFFTVFRPITLNDCLARFPATWIMMAVAARYAFAGIFAFIACLFTSKDDWKSWAYFEAFRSRYGWTPKSFNPVAVMMIYFGADHAIVKLAQELELRHG